MRRGGAGEQAQHQQGHQRRNGTEERRSVHDDSRTTGDGDWRALSGASDGSSPPPALSRSRPGIGQCLSGGGSGCSLTRRRAGAHAVGERSPIPWHLTVEDPWQRKPRSSPAPPPPCWQAPS
ncbi:Uncharacterised protein [Amycolatopsis camponoti]|uniref:Uncharacterized protein n=1 Tax=Amycolatopsis camponoti TaxID=2606593 RepID=A0A6I8LU26_9PSEU|nr:Uncharacterised protein [Amycolatopsis camponoti]